MKIIPYGTSELEQALSIAVCLLELCEKNTWSELSMKDVSSEHRKNTLAQLQTTDINWDILDQHWEPISRIDRSRHIAVGTCRECGWWQTLTKKKQSLCSSPFGCGGIVHETLPARLFPIETQ